MKWGLYLRRNPGRLAPLFFTSVVAIFAVLVLQMLGGGLDANKKAYIEVYRQVQVLHPVGEVAELNPSFIPVAESSFPVKLLFGQAQLPVWVIARQDLPAVLSWLGLPSSLADQGDLLIHHQALAAVRATRGGLPARARNLCLVEFGEGPRLAIQVVEDSPGPSYLVAAGRIPEEAFPGYRLRSYATEQAAIEQEGIFVRTIAGLIQGAILIVMLLASGATVSYETRSRYAELAILQVLGTPRRQILAGVVAGYGWVTGLGSLLGGLLGWQAGAALISALTPGGLARQWPVQSVLVLVSFTLALLSVSAAAAWKAAASADPLAVIERAEQVS